MTELTRPDLTEVNQHVSQYICGEGDYSATDTWAAHQAHYETHPRPALSAPLPAFDAHPGHD